MRRAARGEHAAAPRRDGRDLGPPQLGPAFGGYWNRPTRTKAIHDGWYATGDTRHLDPEGDLWIDGRVDDMIISGGENVHPLEVEDVLRRTPGVVEVAVIGVPTSASGSTSRRSW